MTRVTFSVIHADCPPKRAKFPGRSFLDDHSRLELRTRKGNNLILNILDPSAYGFGNRRVSLDVSPLQKSSRSRLILKYCRLLESPEKLI